LNSVLEVHKLTAGYGGIPAIRNVTFHVERGGITALLGANGAGKSTTLRALCGMIPREGEVRLKGRSVVHHQTEDIAQLGVAHVPEGRGTFIRRTVQQNLELGAITRRDRENVAADIERIYSYFPKLKHRHAQAAGTLSGGEQQMLAIGRALMLRPSVMLLDEPSFGLAPLIVDEVFEILRRLNIDDGLSLVLVEQNATLALQLAQDAHVLEAGQIVLSGLAADLRTDESIKRLYLGR